MNVAFAFCFLIFFSSPNDKPNHLFRIWLDPVESVVPSLLSDPLLTLTRFLKNIMAVGPLARLLAQLVVPVVAVLARALPAAYAQALQNARKAGVDATEAAAPVFGKRIRRSEALQVLNLAEAEATPEAVKKQFERYFEANDVKKGGSFYLQSKVYRAHELLMEFQKEKRQEEQEKAKQ